jgi:hypothetical protein
VHELQAESEWLSQLVAQLAAKGGATILSVCAGHAKNRRCIADRRERRYVDWQGWAGLSGDSGVLIESTAAAGVFDLSNVRLHQTPEYVIPIIRAIQCGGA